jgi:hypothetical protein
MGKAQRQARQAAKVAHDAQPQDLRVDWRGSASQALKSLLKLAGWLLLMGMLVALPSWLLFRADQPSLRKMTDKSSK